MKTWKEIAARSEVGYGMLRPGSPSTQVDAMNLEPRHNALASQVLEVLIRREAVSPEEVRSTLRFVLDRDEEDK